uniref:Uncharacterized protein n=1 Tax=Rhizophora mucronata TaxID=61149 RepID=A0A2P2NI95_RHIMU
MHPKSIDMKNVRSISSIDVWKEHINASVDDEKGHWPKFHHTSYQLEIFTSCQAS